MGAGGVARRTGERSAVVGRSALGRRHAGWTRTRRDGGGPAGCLLGPADLPQRGARSDPRRCAATGDAADWVRRRPFCRLYGRETDRTDRSSGATAWARPAWAGAWIRSPWKPRRGRPRNRAGSGGAADGGRRARVGKSASGHRHRAGPGVRPCLVPLGQQPGPAAGGAQGCCFTWNIVSKSPAERRKAA